MHTLSQLISLPLINLYDIKIEGYIENIYININTRRIEQLLIYDEEFDTYKTVLFSQIYKIGTDAIFIRNSSKITLSENLQPLPNHIISPINSKCYDFDGKYLGTLQDIELKNNVLTSIKINNANYSIDSIIGARKDLLILSNDKKISINRFHPSANVKKIKNLTSILNSEEPVVNILNGSIQPIKQITNYNFLINRVITKDIKNYSGEIIANKDTIVTIKTIEKLRRYGKLKELLLYSK